MSIPRFDPATTAKLKEALPETANVKNPVDVIGDARADRYNAAVDAVLDDPNVDQALVILTPQSMTDIDVDRPRASARSTRRPRSRLPARSWARRTSAPGIHLLQAAHIPHYILPEWACEAMADVQRIRRWREQPIGEIERLPVDRAAAEAILDAAPEGYLTEDQGAGRAGGLRAAGAAAHALHHGRRGGGVRRDRSAIRSCSA